jgi:hypothetical protein
MVDLVGLHLEDLNGLKDQAGQQAGAIGLEEPVQSPSQGVIAQRTSGTPERIAGLRPGFDAIEGAGLERHAFDSRSSAATAGGWWICRARCWLQPTACRKWSTTGSAP